MRLYGSKRKKIMQLKQLNLHEKLKCYRHLTLDLSDSNIIININDPFIVFEKNDEWNFKCIIIIEHGIKSYSWMEIIQLKQMDKQPEIYNHRPCDPYIFRCIDYIVDNLIYYLKYIKRIINFTYAVSHVKNMHHIKSNMDIKIGKYYKEYIMGLLDSYMPPALSSIVEEYASIFLCKT